MHVLISKNAQKQHRQLPQREQEKIKKKLALLEKNPFAGKKLSGGLLGLRSLKAWPYRIIYSIEMSKKQVLVASILHRQEAYK